MDKFLGLPLVRKPLTDAEYVARARKEIVRWHRYGKWLAPFQATIVIVWVCIFGFFARFLQEMGDKVGGQAGNFALAGLLSVGCWVLVLVCRSARPL